MAQIPAPATKENVTIDFGGTKRTGLLCHDDENRVLLLETDEGPERISISLKAYGLTARPGSIFVKDWSEHNGLTTRLAAASLVRPLRTLAVGSFDSTAYEVEVTL